MLAVTVVAVWLGVVSFLTTKVFAQQAPTGGDDLLSFRNIAAYYGVAAPLVVYLLFDGRRKDARIDQLAKRNDELVDASFDKIVPLATEMTGLVRDAGAAAVRRARSLDDDDIARIAEAVRARG